MTPQEAYLFARDNPDCDIRVYQEVACEEPSYACYFAIYINNANIEYCQKHACKDPYWAYRFSLDISESDIEYCYEFSEELKEGIRAWVRWGL